MRRALVLILLLGLAACGGDDSDFAAELGIDLGAMTRTDSGLHIQDLVVGDGEEARAGTVVTAHYTGWLADGTVFDSSLERTPIQFRLGVGSVISGWDEGVQGMLEGGRRRLVIPPELAYGSEGRGGVIPPDATLVFEVELLDVQGG